MTPADPAIVSEIERRTALLGRLFDLSELARAGDTPAKIRRYYRDSRLGYRWVHSSEGAMHMALNPSGVFDRSGYEGQARLVEERLPDGAVDVLELASGNGYNLGLLAAKHRDTNFVGVDLLPTQVERANQVLAERKNVQAIVGDFQDLSFEDNSFDCVFVVESFCHATDLPRAFAEVKRVLRPNGSFIVIDAWRTGGFDEFPASVREAAGLVEHAMAVADTQQLPVWRRLAEAGGLEVVADLDLTDQIVPNLERLARVAETRLVSHPKRARLLKLVVPRSLLTNAVSGFLIGLTVQIGAHTYRLVVLEHAAP